MSVVRRSGKHPPPERLLFGRHRNAHRGRSNSIPDHLDPHLEGSRFGLVFTCRVHTMVTIIPYKGRTTPGRLE